MPPHTYNPAIAPEDRAIAATFGRRLRWERERRELTLARLAVDAGFAQGKGKKSRREVISRYERGETMPLLATAKRLADALEVTLDDLVTEPPGYVPPAEPEPEPAKPAQRSRPQTGWTWPSSTA